MDQYLPLYMIFGVLFVAGGIGFWIITWPLRDPGVVYETTESGDKSGERVTKSGKGNAP